MRVSSIALLASVVNAFPYLLPRGGSFSVNTIHNPKHTAHGPLAKAKAMAKYAHLVESSTSVGAIDYASPCKLTINASPSLLTIPPPLFIQHTPVNVRFPS